ncbi:LptF/LptG family permease [uncultured Dokdonia sp.]|uniref:LptF/LptG family permease n=1 Tax=uncultured Dokdonia sp. TaxID=575653 RepID=UPI002610EA1A|nr:LptF/LptG family permease [uncultured Dokdonia sp.]
MKLLDWYIVKRYIGTFVTMLLLFIPIGITVNLAEKIDKILANEVPFLEVAIYYLNFTVYFANLLFPLFLFLSVIWFTSKLANNTEVIAFLSSGVSFWRFLRPYMIGATVVCLGAFVLGTYLAPKANKGYNEFIYEYLKSERKKNNAQQTKDVFRQIAENDYIYVSSFNTRTKVGRDFTWEHFENNEMTYKMSASKIKFNSEDTTYTLFNYKKRTVGIDEDILESKAKVDTTFAFDIDDLTPVEYIAETLSTPDLLKFIKKEELRGSSYISRYKVTLQKRYSLPVAAYILTIIAVAVSAMKRRGGMGANLAFGILLAFVFIFFDKVFGTLAEQSDFPPLVAVWFPNFLFAILAIYLLRNAKR